MISLSQAEREKFAAYLEQEAKSDDEMAKQLATLPGHDKMIKRMKIMAAAGTLIANKLRSIETETIESQ